MQQQAGATVDRATELVDAGQGNGSLPAPTKLEVERYANSIAGVVTAVVEVEQAYNDLIDEGWPTKIRGDRHARLAELEQAARRAEADAAAIAPTQPKLAEIHVNLRELAEAYSRLATASNQIEDFFRNPEETKQLLAAKEDASRETDEFAQPLQAVAAETGADLTAVFNAGAESRRSLGERLARFGRKLVRPFMPISPLSARRLLAVPFMPPYGPLSPPAVFGFARKVAGAVGWIPLFGGLLALLGFVYTLMAGLTIAVVYYSFVVGWWVVAGWWLSLLASTRSNR